MRHIVTVLAAALIVVLAGAGWAQTGRTVGGPAPDEERMQQMMKAMGDMQEQMKGMEEQMKGMQMTGPMQGRMGQMRGQMAQMQGTMQQHREQMMKQCPMGAPQEKPK
jgi:polyhydroxyalkanoate synthesis regulator protein